MNKIVLFAWIFPNPIQIEFKDLLIRVLQRGSYRRRFHRQNSIVALIKSVFSKEQGWIVRSAKQNEMTMSSYGSLEDDDLFEGQNNIPVGVGERQ